MKVAVLALAACVRVTAWSKTAGPDRRQFLAVSTAGAAIAARPALARDDDDVGARLLARLDGSSAMRCWGVPWSRGADAAARTVAAPTVFPAWLAGEWSVASSKLKDVTFPKGRQFISERTPGARVASLLELPNIGNEPFGYRLRFVAAPGGGAVADRAFNAAQTLEAFWPDCRVAHADARSAGSLALEYAGPTRTRENVSQHVTLTTRFAEAAAVPGGTFVWSEVFAQEAKEQGLRTEYEVVRSATRRDADTVDLAMRAAAFMLPTDALYLDAEGDAVGVYEYAFVLERYPPRGLSMGNSAVQF